MLRTTRTWAIGVMCWAWLGSASAQDAGTTEEPAPEAAAPEQGSADAEATAATEDAEATDPQPEALDSGPNVSDLRAALDALMDDMVSARGRIASLGKALFRTQLSLWVDNRADDQKLTALKLLVDGAPVYDGDGKELRRGESVRLFDGHAAPGKHEVRVEFTQRSVENPDFTYSVSQQFVIEVREDTRTEVTLRLDDDSDIAEELPNGDEGEYDVRTRLRVDPIPLDD